ncbi:phosphoribosyltransferase domain-containing protein, partial [Streptomyces sp. NPDC127106]|uniref:phosphoribosyltransferase domain-containing protein n=1 Tax=Streptomyces sp. NPDC127106 TaxID=3345360 RepID=UPI00363465FE
MTTEKGKTIDAVWSGSWVVDRLGVRLEGVDGSRGPGLEELLGLALRRNPKRAHLLVSQVLGKHVPQSPRAVHAAGYGLGERVRALLDAAGEDPAAAVVLGYAETATGLGASGGARRGPPPHPHTTPPPGAGGGGPR